MPTRSGFISKILSTTLLLTAVARGQAVPQDQSDPEDGQHGVARVSLLNGDVSVRRGDSGDYVAAAINAPLLSQDAVQTGSGSRAEVQFDTANRVRVSGDTEIRFAELTAEHCQVQIARGTLTFAVLSDSAAQAEIDTPSVAIRPAGRGDYRVSVLPDGSTQITARSGSVDVYTPQGRERLQPGQTMLARGAVENPEFQTIAALGIDEWDVFNERRDRELQRSQSYNYVSRDIAGAEDLDNYGSWNSDPQYGQVWTPRVASDWAPYRLGRWAYEDYYGWTWVSSDPWGWAPYHYGNWFRGSYGWSWYPGSRYSHYYYRPALVAFFGFGGGGLELGFGGGWGFGNVGWVPLAPFERYNRWYGRGFGGGYGRGGYNIVNNTNITNMYRNARVGNGVTSLNSQDFANGRFGRYASPGLNQIQQAGAVQGRMPFTPNANHMRFNDRQTAVQGRADFGRTQFASHMQPSQATGSQSFGRQGGFSNSNNRTQPSNFASFGRPGSSQVAQSAGQYNNGSSNWQRFGSPGRPLQQSQQSQQQQFGRTQQGGSFSPSQPANRTAQPQQSGRSPWQRFGDPAAGSRQNFQSGPSPSYGRQNGSASQAPAYNGGQFRGSGSQSVQVAPPMVRERQQGSFGRQQSFGAPNYNQPSYNQPSYNQPSYSRQSNSQPRPESRPAYSQQSQPSYRSAPSQSFGRSVGSAPASHDSSHHAESGGSHYHR